MSGIETTPSVADQAPSGASCGTNKTPGTRYIDVKLNYLDLLPHHTTLAHLLGFGKRVCQGRREQVRLLSEMASKREIRLFIVF